jgi:DNA repair photolyase
MNVIYEPKGRAREYSELACNLYRGCTHGCSYCFAPACMRTTGEDWHSHAEPRINIIAKFEKDAASLQSDPRKVLFCFLSDPYQPLERRERLTHQALTIVGKYKMQSQVLTKGSAELILDDLDLMKTAGTELGITLCFSDDGTRAKWEPNASSLKPRLAPVSSPG